MADQPMTAEMLLHEIATMRDKPAGNEICKQDPLGILMVAIAQARELLKLPLWQEPPEASDLTKAVTAARVAEMNRPTKLSITVELGRLDGPTSRMTVIPPDRLDIIVDPANMGDVASELRSAVLEQVDKGVHELVDHQLHELVVKQMGETP